MCADTLLKDIYETTDAYRRMRPGRSAKSLDSVMDSTVVVATLVLHAIDRQGATQVAMGRKAAPMAALRFWQVNFGCLNWAGVAGHRGSRRSYGGSWPVGATQVAKGRKAAPMAPTQFVR